MKTYVRLIKYYNINDLCAIKKKLTAIKKHGNRSTVYLIINRLETDLYDDLLQTRTRMI